MTPDNNSDSPFDSQGGIGGIYELNTSEAQIERAKATLSRAADVASMLGANLTQHAISSVANSAVTADILSNKLLSGAQDVIGNAAGATMQLQSPLQQQAITQLSQTLGNTSQFGVTPPPAEGAAPIPVSVIIRQQAQQGIATAAIDLFSRTLASHANPPDQAYYQGLNLIEQYIGDNPNAINIFNDAVSRINAANAVTLQSPYAIAGQETPPIPSTPAPLESASSSAGVTPPPGVTIIPVGVNVCSYFNIAALEVQYRNAASPSNPNPVINLGQYIIGPRPGYNTPALTIYYVGNGVLNIVGPPGYGGQIQCALPAVPQPPVIPSPSPIIHPPGSGAPPIIPPVPVPSCPPPVINVTCGSNPPPPQPPPPKKCPPIPECLPGQLWDPNKQQCVDKPKDKQYCLYCSAGGALYIIPCDQSPNNSGDRQLASGDPSSWDLAQLCRQCGIGSPTPSPSSPPAGQPPDREPPGARQQSFPGCDEFGNIPLLPEIDFRDLSKVLGIRNADGSFSLPFPDASITNLPAQFTNILTQWLEQSIDQMIQFGSALLQNSPCVDGQMLSLIVSRAFIGFIEQYTGCNLDVAKIPNDQQRQFRCPLILPDQAQATSAFLGGMIDEKTLECWVRAANYRYPEFRTVVDSQRSKLSPQQMSVALRRKLINRQLYDKYIRESGFIRDFEGQLQHDLTEQIPPPSDLTRFMVRDAGDANLVQQFRLDDQFNQKFAGKIVEWSESQGISEDYMRYIWRAHWSIPSPTQLYEMLHRLSRLPAGDTRAVDVDIVRAALVQQDIAPYWVDKFIAISYRPLTRIDARRAYEIGAIGPDALVETYQNLGYSPDNARILLEFNRLNKLRTLSRRPIVNDYSQGLYSDSEFSDLATSDGATADDIEFMRARAAIISNKNRRKKCLKAVQKRYFAYELDFSETLQGIIDLGVNEVLADTIASGWSCERSSRGRELSASEILSLYRDGVIDEATAFKRLQVAGYDEDDAILKVRQAAQVIQKRLDANNLAKIRRDDQEQRRLQRQLTQAAGQYQRAARRAEAAAARAQKLKEQRERRLIDAGSLVSQHTGMDVADSLFFVRQLHQTVLHESAATIDESIQAIGVAAANKQLNTFDAVRDAVVQFISQLA